MMFEVNLHGERIAYFAYGSCMNRASLSISLCCDADEYFVGPARLAAYRLAFNYPSIRTPATCCANIEADATSMVEGAFYLLPTRFLEALDHREGVSLGRYCRFPVQIHSDQTPSTVALSYRGLVTQPQESAPSELYRDTLIQGLIDARVSESYRLRVISLMTSLRGT